jgi:hypothetical protein
MKGRADTRETDLRIFEAANLKRSFVFYRPTEHSVIGAQEGPLSAANRKRFASAPDTWIDHDEMDCPRGKEWRRRHQCESAGANVPRTDLVGDVNNLNLSGDTKDNALHRSDERIPLPEIRRQSDDH